MVELSSENVSKSTEKETVYKTGKIVDMEIKPQSKAIKKEMSSSKIQVNLKAASKVNETNGTKVYECPICKHKF